MSERREPGRAIGRFAAAILISVAVGFVLPQILFVARESLYPRGYNVLWVQNLPLYFQRAFWSVWAASPFTMLIAACLLAAPALGSAFVVRNRRVPWLVGGIGIALLYSALALLWTRNSPALNVETCIGIVILSLVTALVGGWLGSRNTGG